MISTDNADWFEWMQSYKKFGYRIDGKNNTGSFAQRGSNYKLSNVLAAIGLSQLSQIDDIIALRLKLARNYNDLISSCSQLALPKVTSKGKHAYQSFCIFIDNRDEILNILRNEGIEVQIGTYSLHQQPVFQNSEYCRFVGDMKASAYAYEKCLALPLYHDMKQSDQEAVLTALMRAAG